MMQLKKIKTRYLWIGFIVCLVLGVILIWQINKVENSQILLVLLVIVFVAMSILLQAAISKSFRYKPKPKKYLSKEYQVEDFNIFEKILIDNKFQMRRSSFGVAYIKIEDFVAYKVVIIKDSKTYFSQDENTDNNNNQTTKGIEKCTKFVGFEIFMENTTEVITKTPDFSFQGNNMVYEGFYYDIERKSLIEPNVIEIKEEHLKEYNKLKELLKITE